MADSWYNNLTNITSVISVFTAVMSSICAYLSYRLSSQIRNELKSDERIIVNKVIHPELCSVWDHRACVIMCHLFNKSKRKAYVSKVNAYDRHNNLMNITWSKHINELGMPLKPCELIGIVDTEDLYVRASNGEEIEFCRLEIFHSFSSEPLIVIFESLPDWALSSSSQGNLD